jgi:hypothetical protein
VAGAWTTPSSRSRLFGFEVRGGRFTTQEFGDWVADFSDGFVDFAIADCAMNDVKRDPRVASAS